MIRDSGLLFGPPVISSMAWRWICEWEMAGLIASHSYACDCDPSSRPYTFASNYQTGWSGRMEQSPFHCTFVPHLLYQLSCTCSRHISSHMLTPLTNCFTEYEQRTLYGALAVTLAMLLCLINCRFISSSSSSSSSNNSTPTIWCQCNIWEPWEVNRHTMQRTCLVSVPMNRRSAAPYGPCI